MIAQLRGVLAETGADHAVIDVGGVGYLLHCSTRTLAGLPPPGEVAALLAVTHVRDDSIQLFGFAAAAERDWFRLLTTVQGVGARLALAVLGAIDATGLAAAIAARDTAALAGAEGVGPKLAQRIVNELGDRAGALPEVAGAAADTAAGDAADAVSALANLGYGRSEAAAAVARARGAVGAEAPFATLMPAALRMLAGRDRRT